MAKLDIDVNRRKEPKRPEGLGNNRPNLDYDADRERRFRMRMQSGPGSNRQEAYDDAPRPKHKKNGAKKSKPKQSFLKNTAQCLWWMMMVTIPFAQTTQEAVWIEDLYLLW